MAQLTIVTTPQNSGDGTPLSTAFNYCNSNFNELYNRVQTAPPTTLLGVVGDTAGMYAYDETYFYYCYANYNGTSSIWGQVTQVGNVSVSAISSGTSNIRISDVNGNATTSVGGFSNVVVVANSGQFVSGIVSATGNVRGNYILGNGSQLTGLPQSYSNANVSGLLPVYTGDISAGNVAVTSTISSQGTVSATGNITTAGFFVGDFIGNVVATLSNIPGPSGAVVFNDGTGNAAATAGLVFDNSSPNTLTILGSYQATGNVIAETILGNSILGTLSTASQPNITNVGTLTALSVSGNVTGGNVLTGGQISATGNIRTSGYFFAVQDINVGGDVTATSYTGVTSSVSGNVTGGNIVTGGRVLATGNISANYFIGNGSQLTSLTPGITIQNGNSNVLVGAVAGNVSININGISSVASFTPLGMTLNGDQLTTGTLTAGNLLVGGVVSATGDVTGGNLRTLGSVSALGNVTGGNILFGNGIVSGNGNIVAGQATVTGNVVAGNLVTAGTLTVNSSGLVTAIVNGAGNSVGNIGSSSNYFNTVFAKATSAQYADLAENYESDSEYAPGTVVVFGGEKEITVSSGVADERVAGVISTNPAHLMNAGQPGLPVALRGRVPVMVIGPVVKGDSLVTSSTPGFAQSVGRDRSYGQAVFAKAIETDIEPGEKIIQAVIL
jgi:hypothetical protein